MIKQISNSTVQAYYDTLTTQKFSPEAQQKSALFKVPENTQDQPDSKTHVTTEPEADKNSAPLDMIQLILDARLGIDRKKLDEIEEKIALILDDPNMPDELKQELIQALEEEKEAVLERAKKLMALS